MRILYGITGEGLGHTMRARVVLPHLVAAGHHVLVAASARARALFAGLGFDVVPIEGLAIRYRDGAAQRIETLLLNARRALPALCGNTARALTDVLDFAPEAVISDFDSFSYTIGRALGCRVISLDHHHVVTRFHHPRAVTARVSYDFGLTHSLVRRKLPRCDRYLVTSFYFPEPLRSVRGSTTLLGPIVRPALEQARPTRGEHVLVYQTAMGDRRLEDALRDTKEISFRVYGLGARPPQRNVEYRAFDEERFVEDLASARAVVTNGGFMTLAEATVLGKPILSCPIRHQGEQELNAAWLEHLGLGLRCRRVAPADVRRLVTFTPRTRVRSATTQALAAIDAALTRSPKEDREHA
ncbi:MAG: UDP-glucuronosyltransferase [Polyangiaceae bacterium]|nr:UDP-glucuronosyltransferase [Polyangiaceae bacterium]